MSNQFIKCCGARWVRCPSARRPKSSLGIYGHDSDYNGHAVARHSVHHLAPLPKVLRCQVHQPEIRTQKKRQGLEHPGAVFRCHHVFKKIVWWSLESPLTTPRHWNVEFEPQELSFTHCIIQQLKSPQEHTLELLVTHSSLLSVWPERLLHLHLGQCCRSILLQLVFSQDDQLPLPASYQGLTG